MNITETDLFEIRNCFSDEEHEVINAVPQRWNKSKSIIVPLAGQQHFACLMDAVRNEKLAASFSLDGMRAGNYDGGLDTKSTSRTGETFTTDVKCPTARTTLKTALNSLHLIVTVNPLHPFVADYYVALLELGGRYYGVGYTTRKHLQTLEIERREGKDVVKMLYQDKNMLPFWQLLNK